MAVRWVLVIKLTKFALIFWTHYILFDQSVVLICKIESIFVSLSLFSRIVVKMLVKLATENAHVNPMDLPVTSDLDPKLPANQCRLAICLFITILLVYLFIFF